MDEKHKSAPMQKRRKIKENIQPATSSSASIEVKVLSKPRRNSHKLADLPGMPLDILFEIFRHLMPYDILKLARTTKDFRNLLLSKSSTSVWQDTLRNVPGLPERPLTMSIPAWVNLLFSPYCHYCTATSRKVEWRFRVRVCTKCSNIFLKDKREEISQELYRVDSDRNHILYRQLVPTRAGKRRSQFYLISDLESVQREYDALVDDLSRLAYIEAKEAEIQAIYKHANLCEAWAKLQSEDRDLELRQLREERKDAIVQKLEALGWGEDIRSIRYPDSLAGHKLVDRPQRLTERIWLNIKDCILEYMNKMRENRLKREHDCLVAQRKGIAMELLRAYKRQQLSENTIMPEGPDFCAFTPLQELLDVPSDVELSQASFDHITPLLPDLILAWRKKIHVDLVQALLAGPVFPKSDEDLPINFRDFDEEHQIDYLLHEKPALLTPIIPTDEDEVVQKMGLATTVFSCLNLDCEDQLSRPLFYPQILGHFCFTRGPNQFWSKDLHGSEDPSTSLGTYSMRERKPWACGQIMINSQATEIAQGVVELAGLDPSCATSEQMDSLSSRFACAQCSGTTIWYDNLDHDESIRPLFDWRGAIQHQLEWRRDDSQTHRLIVVDQNKLNDQIQEAERNALENLNEVWGCVHCLDTPKETELQNLASIKRHLVIKHKITSSVLNEDFYRHFSGPNNAPRFLVRQSSDGQYSAPSHTSSIGFVGYDTDSE